MKVKLILSILLAGLLCSTASAETNWVQRFLERYRTPQVSAGGVPSALPPASLGAMVQNGMISLTTEDIVRLLLENNRDVIRVTNSGISAYIRADGSVSDETKGFQQDVRTWTISKGAGGTTFYARHGDVFVYFCALITLGIVSATLMRRRSVQ